MRFIHVLSALLATLGLGVASHSFATSIDLTKPTMVMEGVITGGTIAPLTRWVTDTAGAKKVPDAVNLILNSPGGSVTAGFIFLDRLQALKARGTRVKCYVEALAASMAFQIFLQCDERYSLNTSFLLWHRARISGGGSEPMTGPMLYALGAQLKQLDAHIYHDVAEAMPDAPDHYVRFHFEHETLHTGWNLAQSVPDFLTASSSISGLVEALLSDKTIHSGSSGFFDFFQGELIYIWSAAMPYINVSK